MAENKTKPGRFTLYPPISTKWQALHFCKQNDIALVGQCANKSQRLCYFVRLSLIESEEFVDQRI